MTTGAFVAILHHAGAFTVLVMIAIQFMLIRDELTARVARRLQITDRWLGAAAVLVFIAGAVRVYMFEKGEYYYFHNGAFLLKAALFVLVALVSMYPSLKFARWKKGEAPQVDAATLRTLRRIIHFELAGMVVIIVCAVLMARGIGFVG